MTEKTYAPIRCAHPGCHTDFTPTHSRSLYCDAHRNPEAAAERKRLRDELNDAVERSRVDPRAKTEPPTADALAEPASRAPEAPTKHAGAVALVDVERWASSEELDEHELAAATANDELVVDEKGLGWVSCRWLLGYRTRKLSRLRDVVDRAKAAVGEFWTKDRPLDDAVTRKCAALENDAAREHENFTKAQNAAAAAQEELRRLRAERAESPKTFLEALLAPPPPGIEAATILRAVGFQVATVDSPRGPILVVEGAGG